MNRVIKFCILVLLLLSFNSKAQTPRVLIDTIQYRCRPNDMLLVNDSVISLYGYAYSIGSIRHAFVYTVDQDLNPIKLYTDSANQTTVFKSASLNHDTLFAIGYNEVPGKYYQGMLYKMFDDSVKMFNYGGNSRDLFINGFTNGRNGYGFGYTESYSVDTNPNANRQDFYACKFDLNGALLWQNAYGTYGQEWLATAARSFDSSKILLAGEVGYISQFGFDSAHAFFVLIDTDGQEIWRREYQLDNMDAIDCVYGTTDGFYFSAITELGSTFQYYSIVGKLDMNGNIIWMKKLGYDSLNLQIDNSWLDADPVSINVLQNGDLLICGKWFNSDSSIYKHDGFVARYTSDGDSIWRYDYNSSRYDWFTNSIEDKLGYIYVCGYTNVHSTDYFGNGDILIVKLNANGCVMDTCLMPELPVEPPAILNNTLYPNPFSTTLNISHQYDSTNEPITCNVYNSIGQLINHYTWTSTSQPVSIDTNNWSKGFYIVEIKANGLVDRIKAVKQ